MIFAQRRVDSPSTPLCLAKRGVKNKTLFTRSVERVIKRSDDRVS
jgi:hypothetical protein